MRGLLLAALVTVTPTIALAAPAPAIPYDEFTLPNGLRVLVHTDRKAPIVAVNLWYHVGSKDEAPGRSGFAHLFEHLMYQRSENHPGEFFEPFELVGVTDQNGTTNTDRTNYFQNVPTTALPMALWMESDRMGHLLGAIDQQVLDEQRGVVQNEKRQGENQPYGLLPQMHFRAVFPGGHPYGHLVIGSMNDLNAAGLDDVKNWFRSWYGPNNAVLVLAGDIDVATARPLVLRYFGDIPPTATVRRLPPRIAARRTSSREVATDAVTQTRLVRSWNVPPATSDDTYRLIVLARVLGGSLSSRLDRRLVHQERLADSVTANVWTAELASLFTLRADVRQGVAVAAVEKALDEELRRLLAEGPTAAELSQARTMIEAEILRGLERIGGWGGKADVLARCAIFTGRPDCYRHLLQVTASVTPAQLRAVGRRWLSRGDHTVVVEPGARRPPVEPPAPANLPPTTVAPPARGLHAVASDVDRRAGVPATTSFPSLSLPALERTTLPNGLSVVLARRSGLPLVELHLLVRDAGFASDAPDQRGTAAVAMDMLDEGAGAYDALALGDRVEALGARLTTGANRDHAWLQLSALSRNLDPSLALLSDVLLRPILDGAELERVRARRLAELAQTLSTPRTLASRTIYPLLYGEAHPYAAPPGGVGTQAGLAGITAAGLRGWVGARLRPDRATLLVVGDASLDELRPRLVAALGEWRAPEAERGVAPPPPVGTPAAPRVFLIDQPGAGQAVIMAGQVLPPTTAPGATTLGVANTILGGLFTSRINMNLREDKHWSYGAFSDLLDAVGPRPWLVTAPVQTNRAAESMAELDQEIRAFATGAKPVSAEELAKVQASIVRALPGSFETALSLTASLGDLVVYGRPDDFEARRAAEVQALTPAAVQQAAAALRPDALTWVVVGDLAKIEDGIRALRLGEVKVLDATGKVVR